MYTCKTHTQMETETMATQTYGYNINEGSLRAIRVFFLAKSRKEADEIAQTHLRSPKRDRLEFIGVRAKSFLESLVGRGRGT